MNMNNVSTKWTAWGAAALLMAAAGAVQAQEITPPGSAATASTNDGNVPANSVDGNLNTRWSGFGSGAWLQFDLGGTRLLKYVKVAAHMGNQRRNMFEVHTSADTAVWTVLMGGQTSGTTTQLETFTVPGTPFARYVRYVGRGNTDPAKAGWNSVSEMEVWAYPNGPPAAPTNLRAQPDAGKVTLTWNAASASQFQIWRRLSQCDTYTQVGTSNATTFTDMNVVDRRHYYYYVVAVNSGGTSPPSDPIAVTPQIQPPAAPTLTATAGPADSGRVDLSWSAIASATRYTVKRTTANVHCSPSAGTPAAIATVNPPATTYTDTTAVPGVTYYYLVSATNITGEGADSERVLVLALRDQAPTPPPTPTPCPTGTPVPSPIPPTATPPAPHSLSVEAANGRIRLTWNTDYPYPNGPKYFSVYRAVVDCGPYVQVARKLSTYPFQYVDGGLTNGTTYYYFVVGTNDRGDSLDSETVGATPANVPPKAPTGLTATNQPGPTVRLTWNEVLADSYTVKRGAFSGGPYTTIASGIPTNSGATRTWDDTSVAAGTVYYYVVAGVSSSEGPHSNEAQVLTPGAMPAPFLTANPQSSAIALAWTSIPGATSYRLRSAAAGCSAFSDLATITGTSYSFATSSATRRYFQVIAMGSGTESTPSNTAASSAYIVTAMPPTVTATAGSDRVTVSWSAVGGATLYRILRGRQELFCSVPIAPVYELLATTSATSHVDVGVHPSSTYFYRVSAVVPGGETQAGDANARVPGVLLGPTPTPMGCPWPTPTPTGTPTPTPAPGVIPGAPANFSAAAGHQKVTLSWDHGSYNGFGEIGYSVYRGTTACGPYQLLQRDVKRPPYVDSGLANGGSYVYIVTSRNQNSEGPQSQESLAAPANGPPPPLDGIIGEPSRPYVRFRWKPAYGAADYVVRRATSSEGPFSVVGTTTADEFIDRTGSPGVTYVYQATARNGFGESAPRTLTGASQNAPAAPSGLTAANAGAGIALQWTASPAATQYKVYRHTATDGYFAPIATVGTTAYSDQSGLTSTVRYYYVVTALSAAESEPSNVASAVAGQTDVEITPPSSRVTASTNDGNVPGNTVDSNLGTRWAGYGGGAWIRYDLGATRTVTRLNIAVYKGNTRHNSFYIQQSPDNSTWYTVWAGQSSGTTTGLETYDIPDTSTRYIRYYGNGNINSTGADTAWNSVTEVEIFAVP